MKLNHLLEDLYIKNVLGETNIEISDIQIDSRKVKNGDLFIALPGHTVDGHQFINKAIEKGAVAVVTEKETSVPDGVTEIRVRDSRKAMTILANTFFGNPSQKLNIIGITGTNGKTTTSNLIEHILTYAGYETGLIGTIHTKYKEKIIPSTNTTPENLELLRLFKQMVDEKVTHVVMEVSSHALVQGRTRGVEFHTGIFSNLTQDHLDYHKTMDEYKRAKGLLFSQLGNHFENRPKYAILNSDDKASSYYESITNAQTVLYGIDNFSDISANNISITPLGTKFTLSTPTEKIDLHLKLIGKFNIYNTLSAISACLFQGISLSIIKECLELIEGVPGRFEAISEGQPYNVIVDYAHTPDSLENVLKTIKSFAKGKIITIVGCGGDRDKTKRPIMADISINYSDFSIFTADNPRSEAINDILSDMTSHLKNREVFCSIENREEAIEKAINLAKDGDCVLIAGKGHETYQVLKNETIHFDDREMAKKYMSKRPIC